MAISVAAMGIRNNIRVNNIQVILDRHPNRCPICNLTQYPENVNHIWSSHDWLEILFRCTNPACSKTFIAFYTREPHVAGLFSFQQAVPEYPIPIRFDVEIAELSPSFVTIFNQATAAEGMQLQDIAGPGYRKALEFLLKDYAISLAERDSAAIKKLPLEQVIVKYMPGEKLPVVSARAAWLGNYETHYERRWIGKDLNDLKKLIQATVHFISMQKLAADLPTDMPDPRQNFSKALSG